MDARDHRSRTDERLVGFEPSHAARAWTTPAALDAPDVVVIGAGIAGTQLAARLSRRGAKVALVTGGPLPPRRLIDGCSLRRATLRTMAEAMDTRADALAFAIGDGAFYGLRLTATRRQAPSVARQFESLDWAEAIGMSARHADIVCALRGFVPGGVALVPGEVAGYVDEQHRLQLVLASGESCDWALSPRTTIVNTASRYIGKKPPLPPRRWVVAAQQPIAYRRDTSDGPTQATFGWAPSFAGTLGWQLGFVTPFSDSASAETNGYAINTMLLEDATLQQAGKEAALADVRAGLDRCVAALGATAIEPEATTGGAVVPVVEDFAPTLEGGLVELHAALSPGAPAINVDGMLAQSLGVAALCEALPELLGDEQGWLVACRAMVSALEPVRKANRLAQWNYFKAPYLVRRLSQASLSLLGELVVRQWADLGR